MRVATNQVITGTTYEHAANLFALLPHWLDKQRCMVVQAFLKQSWPMLLIVRKVWKGGAFQGLADKGAYVTGNFIHFNPESFSRMLRSNMFFKYFHNGHEAERLGKEPLWLGPSLPLP